MTRSGAGGAGDVLFGNLDPDEVAVVVRTVSPLADADVTSSGNVHAQVFC